MIHSFLLIGQSNMAGRGFLSEAIPVDTTRIKTLRNGRWQKMFRPINPDRSFSGVNLGESFAEAYAKQYNVDVGLICAADGGTKLEQWQVGGAFIRERRSAGEIGFTHLYDCGRAKNIQRQLRQVRKEIRVLKQFNEQEIVQR